MLNLQELLVPDDMQALLELHCPPSYSLLPDSDSEKQIHLERSEYGRIPAQLICDIAVQIPGQSVAHLAQSIPFWALADAMAHDARQPES